MKKLLTVLVLAITMGLSAQEMRFEKCYVLEYNQDNEIVSQSYIGGNSRKSGKGDVVFFRKPPTSNTNGMAYFEYYEIVKSDTITEKKYFISKKESSDGVNLFHLIGEDGLFFLMYENARLGKPIKRIILQRKEGNSFLFESK